MRIFPTTFALPACLLLGSICLAEPTVEYLDPPSVGRGQKCQMAVVGNGVDRAIGIWTSLPPEKVKVARVVSSEPARTHLELDVAADCPLGLYGLRLASEDGLSNLQLFVVDDLVPRPTLASPQTEFPVAVSGQLRPSAVDRYPIEVAAGQRLSFDVVCSRFGTDADPLLTIYDADGRRVAQRDNDPGLFFDCCFEHLFEREGTYTVEVRDSRFQGAANFRYVLRMGNFPAARVAIPSSVRPGEAAVLKFPELPLASATLDVPRDQPLGGFYYAFRRPTDSAANWIPLVATQLPSVVEVEPNNTPEQGTLVENVPIVLHGIISAPGDKDHFALNLKKGQRLAIRAETKPLGSAADVELLLFDPTGREVQRSDDTALPGGALDEAAFNFNAGVDGKHQLLVREMTRNGGADFAYRIEVQLGGPRLALTSEFAALTVPQSSYQMFAIAVVRTEYNGPINLSLIGGPAGLRLEPAVIPEGENSVLCKLFAAADAPQGIHSLAILGTAQAGEAQISSRVVFQPLVDKVVINVDLIKYGLRDNQRWLPPSVADRLAIQITPATPFTADVPEGLVTLPRYQQVEFPIQTERAGGFDGEISFSAIGGQVGEEAQGRRQVFHRFPKGTTAEQVVKGQFHSRSQANEAKDRVDLTATAKQGTRSITLRRSLTLAVKPAFEIVLEPATITLQPGATAKVKIVAHRLPSFSGPVTITPNMSPGIAIPETITIPAGQPSIDIDLAVVADYKPRRDRIRFTAVGQVGSFQEEPRAPELDVEVKAPAAK